MNDSQGWIMDPPGPEAWKRLRTPRKIYICNIDLILVPLPSVLIYVVNRNRNVSLYIEISGLKVVENFRLTGRSGSLSGPGPWSFSITSLVDEPALMTVAKVKVGN